MTDLDNFFNLSNDYFSLSCKKCIFRIEEVLKTDGQAHNVLMVYPVDKEVINYAFSGNQGLCLTTPHGSLQNKNILGTLISLPGDNVKKILHFFEEHGYLLPITAEGAEVDIDALVEILNRIKATVLLMTALEKPSLDYDQILHLSLFLLMSKQVTLNGTAQISYTTYKHPFLDSIRSQSTFDSLQQFSEAESIVVKDMIYVPSYELKADEYDDISNGETFTYDYPGINDTLYRQITIAYKNKNTLPKNYQLMVEFLFHYMHSVGVIKTVSFDNGIEYYGIPDYSKFDEQLTSAVVLVARLVLSGEINHNTRSIKPFYSPNSLEPSWKAPSLLTALYFSIFYMKPGSEIYRKCANPSCNKYFLVKTSNSRKKYCCDSCRNANNQRSHRIKTHKGK
ncbi:MAG: hypothetical protein RR670_01965 [Erysipelotrichaceae bacterium]